LGSAINLELLYMLQQVLICENGGARVSDQLSSESTSTFLSLKVACDGRSSDTPALGLNCTEEDVTP
jgi:hypothetical protein